MPDDRQYLRDCRNDHRCHDYRQWVSDWTELNSLKPSQSSYYTLPYRSNPPHLISDIRALWRSWLSARVPECQSEIENGRLGLYGAEYSKFNRMITPGFKGLTPNSTVLQPGICHACRMIYHQMYWTPWHRVLQCAFHTFTSYFASAPRFQSPQPQVNAPSLIFGDFWLTAQRYGRWPIGLTCTHHL